MGDMWKVTQSSQSAMLSKLGISSAADGDDRPGVHALGATTKRAASQLEVPTARHESTDSYLRFNYTAEEKKRTCQQRGDRGS